MPCASGIIDDLIVKAKVFGAYVGQFLLSFLKISASSVDVLGVAPFFARKPAKGLRLCCASAEKARICSALFEKSFNAINMLCKKAVKFMAIFFYGNLVGVPHGFLFVFPEANLYNAARLAGRVSFEVILK